MREIRVIATDVPWCDASLSVTRLRPLKTAERIKVLFGVETHGIPRNIVIRWEEEEDAAGRAFAVVIQITLALVVLLAVLGCADLESAPSGATISRHGNTTVIRCVTSSLTWSLVCVGAQWTGPSQHCPATGASVYLLGLQLLNALT